MGSIRRSTGAGNLWDIHTGDIQVIRGAGGIAGATRITEGTRELPARVHSTRAPAAIGMPQPVRLDGGGSAFCASAFGFSNGFSSARTLLAAAIVPSFTYAS